MGDNEERTPRTAMRSLSRTKNLEESLQEVLAEVHNSMQQLSMREEQKRHRENIIDGALREYNQGLEELKKMLAHHLTQAQQETVQLEDINTVLLRIDEQAGEMKTKIDLLNHNMQQFQHQMKQEIQRCESISPLAQFGLVLWFCFFFLLLVYFGVVWTLNWKFVNTGQCSFWEVGLLVLRGLIRTIRPYEFTLISQQCFGSITVIT